MAMQRDRYPENWDAISMRIRERAGWKCEECGVENGADILRSTVDGSRYIVLKFIGDDFIHTWPDGSLLHLSDIPDEYPIGKNYTRVVLTVHHIGTPYADGTPGDPHDKMDCRDENLISLCQRCHLLADMPHHVANARITRLLKREKAIAEQGQLSLFEGEQS